MYLDLVALLDLQCGQVEVGRDVLSVTYHDDVVARMLEDERYGAIEYGTSRAALLATYVDTVIVELDILQSLHVVDSIAGG